jgi:hypothetical protein
MVTLPFWPQMRALRALPRDRSDIATLTRAIPALHLVLKGIALLLHFTYSSFGNNLSFTSFYGAEFIDLFRGEEIRNWPAREIECEEIVEISDRSTSAARSRWPTNIGAWILRRYCRDSISALGSSAMSARMRQDFIRDGACKTFK